MRCQQNDAVICCDSLVECVHPFAFRNQRNSIRQGNEPRFPHFHCGASSALQTHLGEQGDLCVGFLRKTGFEIAAGSLARPAWYPVQQVTPADSDTMEQVQGQSGSYRQKASENNVFKRVNCWLSWFEPAVFGGPFIAIYV